MDPALHLQRPTAASDADQQPIRTAEQFIDYVRRFTLWSGGLFAVDAQQFCREDFFQVNGEPVRRLSNEYWTSGQRQGHSIHEVSYRACFKPQLPEFFIRLLTAPGDAVYDPFAGRGTTAVESALLGRRVVANDVNPLSRMLSEPRLNPPYLDQVAHRLAAIPLDARGHGRAGVDLSMFYDDATLAEIVSLKEYLSGHSDPLDKWIRMVATNRLTGHSSGFFSIYTLPPNQAISAEGQRKINEKRAQRPAYRNTKEIILRKTASLLADLTDSDRTTLASVAPAKFYSLDARRTRFIRSNSVTLTVTSPPFLDVVQYGQDNWLRCWFNDIPAEQAAKRITMMRKLDDWALVMGDVLRELYRVTTTPGWVAFEVGEVRGGTVRLDEVIAPLGVKAGFECVCVMVNEQNFTKTANCWGVRNNQKGTNTNRIVLFLKPGEAK